jgi:5,10-methylenetetrahydromethanopterin reductase
MHISCAFATSLDTPEHIALAERLGYKRAWCYDSPALYADVWMTLARAAERTSVIGLGPGVLIPHLRHVMTNAAAIATLAALAPGRVAVAIGSGFTGRLAMGQRPHSWKTVREYVLALRSLLRGEQVEWEGAVMQMLHPDGFAAPRPVNVPIVLGISGPRGLAVAAEVADGIIGSSANQPGATGRFDMVCQMTNGTVLDAGEAPDLPRVMQAAGHGAALVYHSAYERGVVESLPGGAEFRRLADALPERTRHLAMHDRHLVALNDIDMRFLTADTLQRFGRALTVEAWQQRLRDVEAAGVTELIYQPAGDDIPRELTAFASMAGLAPRS